MGEFATKITAVGRMHLARSNFQTMRTGAVLLQALIRCRALESKFARYEVGIRQSPLKIICASSFSHAISTTNTLALASFAAA